MKQRIKGLYKLARPINALSGGLAVILGGYVAGTGEWLNVILAAITALLVTGAGNAWNDYLDIEIDKVNQPQRALPAQMVSPRSAVILAVLLNIAAIILAAFINLPSFLIVLFFSILLYIYSWKLKSTVLVGNLTVAITTAMTVIYGGVAAGNARPTVILALIICVAILGREVLKTIADYEGDLLFECRTIATVWGKRPARVVFFLTTGTAAVMMMMPYAFKIYSPIYGYIVALGVFPIIAYVVLQVKGSSTGRQLERLSQMLKYDFLVWFVAVLVGAAV